MAGRRRLCIAAAFALLLLLAPSARFAHAQWPQFRGPRGDGHSTATGLPVTWNEGENLAWKVAVPGRGFSSPVISEGKIWLTTALEVASSPGGGQMESFPAGGQAAGALRALAFDQESGRMVNDVEVFRPGTWQHRHAENSYASPTPVVEAGRVYVHFGDYGTACLSTADGEVIWRSRELRLDHEHGPGSSPILWRDLLIVNGDGIDRRYVAALDKRTGELAWKTRRSVDLGRKLSHGKAFATPLVIQSGGRPQLISPGARQVSSYDPATGEEIWRVRYDGYSNVPRPVAGLGLVFVDTGYVKPHMLAIHPGGHGDVTDSHVRWSYHWQVPANPSPLLIGDRLFMISDHGNASWLDARKGEDLWRRRLGGRHYASPIYASGRVFTFSREGRTVVIEAGDSYREIARAELDGSILASPAVAGSAFFVRTESHLYRLEER